MKTIRLKLLTLMWVIGVVLPITSQAYDFEYDGIYYNILSKEDMTVEVTRHEELKYTGNISIPQKLIKLSKSYSVTAIGNEAFKYCTGLTSVEIPSSVTAIGNSAFYDCSGLTSVDIPSSVITIGDEAFRGCGSLTSVEIPNSVITIGDEAFSGCGSLTSVEIPNSVTTIGDGMFLGCSRLSNVVVSNSVTKIGHSMFAFRASLSSVKIPSSVTTIGSRVFYRSGIENISIPNSVTCICDEAFCYSVLKNVTIPNSVTYLGSGAFQDSYIASVVIPNSVTTIEEKTFYSCEYLKSVDIPSTIKSIGDYAFGGYRFGDLQHGTKLRDIYCHWEIPISASSNVFYTYNGTLYVPIGTKTKYKETSPWCYFSNIEEIDYNAMSTSISNEIGSNESTLEETDRFDISGKHVSEDYKGLVIIRYSDGSTRKTIIK